MKRFTETNKWGDPWFLSLHPGEKLLFIYLIENCNNAGFWEENERMVCFQLGITSAQYKGALKGLARGIEGASGWIWIRNFLRHQNNLPLNPENPAHRQIIGLLDQQSERFGEKLKTIKVSSPKGATKGLPSPIGTGKGKEKKESVRGNNLSDDEWREQIANDPTYLHLDIGHEFGKMTNYCAVKHLKPSRQRFVNWLNRIDPPLNAKKGARTIKAPLPAPEPESPGFTDEQLAANKAAWEKAKGELVAKLAPGTTIRCPDTPEGPENALAGTLGALELILERPDNPISPVGPANAANNRKKHQT